MVHPVSDYLFCHSIARLSHIVVCVVMYVDSVRDSQAGLVNTQLPDSFGPCVR